MTTAEIALVVAALSLGWNIVAWGIRWRSESGKVLLDVRQGATGIAGELGYPKDPEDSLLPMLWVWCRNVGRAPVEVTDLEFDLGPSSGWHVSPLTLDGQQAGIIRGPLLPQTILPNHSESWILDIAHVFGADYLEHRPTPFAFRVTLASGETEEWRGSVESFLGDVAFGIAAQRRKDSDVTDAES